VRIQTISLRKQDARQGPRVIVFKALNRKTANGTALKYLHAEQSPTKMTRLHSAKKKACIPGAVALTSCLDGACAEQ
jgi:hypothetical protein